MAEIRLSGLEKVYDNGFRAVKGIDLRIRDREFMVLVGPSGCGKTTTLRMIAGLEDATGGEIRIGERVVNEVEPKDRDIAMVFQNYALYPHMTVADNMSYALRLRGVPKAEVAEQVRATAALLGLSDQLGKRPKELSGGQRQRVALGRAIVRRPQAFLFDEPLSNLDAKLRGDMRYELKTLQARLATTTVYVTHDQVEAMTLGDRITVMSQGEIQQVGDPTTVYRYPRNRFVAAFIGTPPMNLIAGRVERADDAWWFRAGGAAPIRIDTPHAQGLAAVVGAPATLGVRPEHLSPAADSGAASGPAASTLLARVTVVEQMGDHQVAYLQLEGLDQVLTMRCDAGVQLRAGDATRIAVATTAAHIFAGEGELAPNVTLPPEADAVAAGGAAPR